MPNFQYEAIGSDGAITRGQIDAPTRTAAVEKILGSGRTPVRIVDTAQGTSLIKNVQAIGTLDLTAASSRLTVLQEFAILLKAGLTVERAVTILQTLTAKPKLRQSLQSVLEGLRAGEPLSGAMKRAASLFPLETRQLVAAGEASGKLPEVMSRIADGEQRSKNLTDKVISAMIYPALLVVVMLIVLTIIFTTVLPRLEPLFAQSGATLPWAASTLVAISHFLDNFGTAMGVALVAALAGILYAAQQPWGRFALDRHTFQARYLLSIPKHYQAAQFCRNVSMLLEGGVPLNRALEIAREAVSNNFMKSRMEPLIEGIKHGRTFRNAMEEAAVFPPLAVEFVGVGEETGRTGPMLREASEILDRDVQTKLERLSALLLPAVTIVLGLIVAGIMSGVVSGIMAANDLAL